MRKIYTLVTLGFVLLVAGCKTASKLYDKGNYDDAVQLAVKKLQKINPRLITLIRIQGGHHNDLPSFDEYHNFIRDILKY